MSQKMYFTVNGVRVSRIFESGLVEFSLPGLEEVLKSVKEREGYREMEYGPEVQIPVTTLMRYIEGASVEVVSE